MASQATLDRLQAEFDSPAPDIAAAVALLEDRAPPAFIARFRRWAVGNMPPDRLHALADRLHFLADLEQRKAAIAQQAQERGCLTEQLQQTLQASVDQDLLDDIYQSLRPRRRTAAMQMEEKGLSPLALAIQHRQLGELSLQEAAQQYVAEANGLPTIEAVLEGVLLILAERIATDPATRERCRQELRRGVLRAHAVDPTKGKDERYAKFFDFAEPIGRIGAGRMLALRRAEREGILRLELGLPEGQHRELLRELHGKDLAEGSVLREFYDLVFDHAWQHGLQETCGRDVRRRLKERADREAVRTHARNLRSLLLAPALGDKRVLALRTSSKTIWAALLGEDGSVLQHVTLHTNDDAERAAAEQQLCDLIRAERPAAIAVPHGRRQAGAEKTVEQLRRQLGDEAMPMVVAVDEAASAIFATSPSGRKALPSVEVGVRTAISLGRRLQDPMRELLHMDVRSLGLGQTLDDVHQGVLRRELDAVIESCVATVGVDLNTADAELLQHVPGMGPDLARAIVEHRRRIGGFQTRSQLLEVPGIDATTSRNIAGFLLLRGGTEPLDGTAVHPEDYDIVRRIAERRGVTPEGLIGDALRDLDLDSVAGPDVDRRRVLAVVQALRQAGRDPRGELTATTNPGVHSFEDLRADLELRGRVANLTEFGAFVDLGIGHDGLVHITQIPGYRLRDTDQMLRVGEVIQVWVLHVDAQGKKISLTMHKPRHLVEGRTATVGERLERGQRRRERRRDREEQPVFSRVARAPESRRGQRRRPPLSAEGKPEAPREAAADSAPRGERRREREDRPERDFRPRGSQQSRVYTVESERVVQEQKGHKGEMTSLSSLRDLLRRAEPKTDDAG